MNDDAMGEHFKLVFGLGSKVKAAMLEKGKRQAWTVCPKCKGKVYAVLAGNRNHLHMRCSSEGCDVWMME